jgi:hypothetical protein
MQGSKTIMKKSSLWCRFVIMTGVLLGLLVGMGFAGPASASTEAASTASVAASERERNRADDAELRLRVNANDRLAVIGENFEGNNVRVVVREVNSSDDRNRDRDRVVFRDRVMPDRDGNFRVRVDIDCENRRFVTFQATASSARDGDVRSERLRVDCRDLRR